MNDEHFTSPLAHENPEFTAWVKTVEPQMWAKFDLSAARIGWEAARRAQPVRVKALEWNEYEHEGVADRWDAEVGGFGVFYCVEIQHDGYCVVFDHEAVGAVGTFDTLEAAKAAAQADYERRILSGLVSQEPQPGETQGDLRSTDEMQLPAPVVITDAEAEIRKAGVQFLHAADVLFDWVNGNDAISDYDEQNPGELDRLNAARSAFQAALTPNGGSGDD